MNAHTGMTGTRPASRETLAAAIANHSCLGRSVVDAALPEPAILPIWAHVNTSLVDTVFTRPMYMANIALPETYGRREGAHALSIPAIQIIIPKPMPPNDTVSTPIQTQFWVAAIPTMHRPIWFSCRFSP